MDGEVSSNEPEIVPDRKCPTCESNLIYKIGRYGKFIGCSNYPECKHIEPLEKPKATDTLCPKCTKGQIIQRRSRRGKYFYSCETYPKCDYAIWNEPINEKCEKCEWPIKTLKETKRFGKEIVCPECGDKKPAPEEAE
jgi:DNA topoisomerase-1